MCRLEDESQRGPCILTLDGKNDRPGSLWETVRIFLSPGLVQLVRCSLELFGVFPHPHLESTYLGTKLKEPLLSDRGRQTSDATV